MPGRKSSKKRKANPRGSTDASVLARTVAAAKRRKKAEAITAALEESQRSSTMERQRPGMDVLPSMSPLARKVEEAKRRKKREAITAAMKKGHRGPG